MSYIPNPTIVTEPADGESAKTAAAEFRALKIYIRDTILASLVNKVSKSGDVIQGGLLLAPPAGNSFLTLVRTTQATGQVAINFNTADSNATWQILKAINSERLDFYTSAGRTVMTLGVDGTVDVPIKITAGAFVGDGSQLTNLPSSSYTLTDSGIISALGYTPYSAANPSSYLTSISGPQVVAALGFTPVNSGNIGTNATGNKTISTAAPSGGVDGDIWYQVT